jgi:hypothetical protein
VSGEEEFLRRRLELTEEIRRRQAEMGHDSPIPSFLNVVTERLIRLEMAVEEVTRQDG